MVTDTEFKYAQDEIERLRKKVAELEDSKNTMWQVSRDLISERDALSLQVQVLHEASEVCVEHHRAAVRAYHENFKGYYASEHKRMDDLDRELIIKLRHALDAGINGSLLKDFVDEDDVIDALILLINIVDWSSDLTKE